MTMNHTYDRIIVPLDGSEPSRAALTYAATIPTKELVLLHVMVDREVIVPEWILRRTSSREETSLADEMERMAEELRTPEREPQQGGEMRLDGAPVRFACRPEVSLLELVARG